MATAFLAFGAGLLLSLWACAYLTPRAWWRRPNLRAGGALAAGTAVLGTSLYMIAGDPPATETALAAPSAAPVAGARYRTHDALNLRAATGTDAPRLAVVPAGSRVVATGERRGDWWQVRADVDGRQQQGWASSLWLRRADEHR
ncbi:SH3 domain-containing protein [Massilia sp. ZL223]|uniref:SH3 domain-containing protein n=1 Tax=Massilia sp. ZL223 TaxID=2824904 RepID=UPI001B844CB7|nr:SH3 domain-containing protein [Massilia sp. ZL223]MBQ5965886.1 SH3 domain-containing protein [Massilia sp. ZL223]